MPSRPMPELENRTTGRLRGRLAGGPETRPRNEATSCLTPMRQAEETERERRAYRRRETPAHDWPGCMPTSFMPL